ncbi:uncharacterized protein MELLADRAFT_62733 [Melampsora larici-populina 98AG31]|uniref:Uncharacterized protein n=1 Tax=Melampsora larici-populina (strain 98AG31 / pathotype 3-4-7) TaxID=747676 RepID=F4RK09_MELLP|nr:uncharacterized protein MELLADRAFT_62733 [Melampsora larici-populina 98AG31]EGG07269.1 hypothetical protein MELLADRAFT_62733 [Melampsora larici-populina 98AG31]
MIPDFDSVNPPRPKKRQNRKVVTQPQRLNSSSGDESESDFTVSINPQRPKKHRNHQVLTQSQRLNVHTSSCHNNLDNSGRNVRSDHEQTRESILKVIRARRAFQRVDSDADLDCQIHDNNINNDSQPTNTQITNVSSHDQATQINQTKELHTGSQVKNNLKRKLKALANGDQTIQDKKRKKKQHQSENFN